jgi:hypothetical protein
VPPIRPRSTIDVGISTVVSWILSTLSNRIKR